MGEKDKSEDILSLSDLEKSWSDSKDLLKAILDDENTNASKEKTLSKAKEEKGQDLDLDDEKEEDDEDYEEDDEDGDDEEGMKKSLEETIQADEEAAAAMDVEPFLRRMVKSMSKHLEAIEAANARLSSVLAKSLLSIGEQNLVIASTVDAIANTPVGTRSIIRKSLDRFPEKPEGENPDSLLKSMNNDQILEKALSLVKSGKLTSRDVAKIQTRLNKSIQLPAEYVAVLTTKGDK